MRHFLIRFSEMLRSVSGIFLQVFFPRRCPVCDRIVLPYGEKICVKCIPQFRPVRSPWCSICGKPMQTEGTICYDCSRTGHKFIRGRTLYEYRSCKESIYRFKYGNRPEYAEYYGEQIAILLQDFIEETDPDMLIPIPLHRKRLSKRGYNQAALLAKAISKHTQIPASDRILVRVRNTIPMKFLAPSERTNNMKKAFIVRENGVKLKTIIVIDDIYTTGATIDAAAEAFLEAGVENIYFITLAGGKGI